MTQDNIHSAINKVMQEVGYVHKTRAANLTYSFAGEAALIAALRPAMVEAGIYASVIAVDNITRENITTRSGAQMINTLLTATVRFTHVSGSFVDVVAIGEGSDSGDKSANKAMTGAYKYALRQTFCIETGDDPDKYPSEERAPAKQAQPAQPLNVESEQPAPMVKKDDRVWTQAQKSALIEAGLAKNDFAAKGMLGLSRLKATAKPEQVVEWGTIYRSYRLNPDETENKTAVEAAELANTEYRVKLMKELGHDATSGSN